ncbi:hypothetical protein BCO71033_00762 [Burkholderia contaminans]|uniref:Uncharacterized protein n=1 Tax=Burkholderia contaminans TaxID=488447 RepID=A0A6P2VBS8_9BURK|nr:hypothetical protein BCO71033_00762 [Burkholderia contaminans]
MCGARRASVVSTSRSAAACSDVTMPIARGWAGNGRLRSGANSPSLSSCAFSRRNASYRRPCPVRRTASTLSCTSPRGSYIVTTARTSIRSPSRGVNSAYCARPRNITQRICACWSLIEKYQWPLAARVKFDTSPEIHSSGNERSSIVEIARLSAETGITSSPPRVAPGAANGESEGMDGRMNAGGDTIVRHARDVQRRAHVP